MRKLNKKVIVSKRNEGVKFNIKKGDTVEVITGDNRGKRGEVLSVDRKLARVVVKGINLRKKTIAKTQENPKGGIMDKENPIHISNVMYVAKENKPTRLGRKVVDGKIKRYEKISNEIID